ncbi:MAG: hypothetical protein AB7N76_05150 [Planctomycetota bacterium]
MTETEARVYETQVRETNETVRRGIEGTRDLMVEHERAKAARYRSRGPVGYPPPPAYQSQPQPGYQQQPQGLQCPSCGVVLLGVSWGMECRCGRCFQVVVFPTRGVAYVKGQ